FFTPFRSGIFCARYGRELLQGTRHVENIMMRIFLHGQPDITVPSENLCHLRMNSTSCEAANELASQRMKIKNATVFVLVGNPAGFEVETYHLSCRQSPASWPKKFMVWSARYVLPHHVGHVHPQQLNIRPAML